MLPLKLVPTAAIGAREAAKACEDCYDAVIAGTWPGLTPEKLERILEDERYRKGRQLK